ncbi:unnamed protein product [Rhizoctonia solani]|uniref:MYND-type domain-containing protein n=2 Tax=Rhizoctonia solani TaxID=456999 RepID=A0A8H3GLP3_9AGAM|nr:MYND finger protein [Rhizoctonia solani 123E]CAE6460673.1 unnamed protein product [Rhizoctonia solani]
MEPPDRRDHIATYGEDLSTYPAIFLRQFPQDDPWTRADTKRLLEWMEHTPASTLPVVDLLERNLRYSQITQFIGRIPGPINEPLGYYTELIRRYAAKHKIFDRYFGFLCVYMITRILQYGTISYYYHVHPRPPDMLDFDPTVRDDESIYLTWDVTHALMERCDDPKWEEVVAFNESSHDDRILLAKLDGFSLEDAEALLNWIWDDRKAFTVLCSQIRMEGWSVLFYVIWAYIRESGRAELYCKKLRHLTMRYSLGASRRDDLLASGILLSIQKKFPVKRHEREIPPVDSEDAQRLLDLCRDNLSPEKGATTSAFDLMFYTTLSIGRDQLFWYLDTIVLHTWEVLQLSSRTGIAEARCAFFHGRVVLSSFWAIFQDYDYASSEKLLMALNTGIQVMNQPRFLEFLARICSLLVMSSKGRFILEEHDAEWCLLYTMGLMEGFGEAADDYEFTKVPEMERIWNELNRFIDIRSKMMAEAGPLRNRIVVCQRMWEVIGATYEFSPRSIEKYLCMNARCPDPDPEGRTRLMCGRCCWVYYCSSRCQIIHWNNNTPHAHRQQCISYEFQ